jgi:hypothetical protein
LYIESKIVVIKPEYDKRSNSNNSNLHPPSHQQLPALQQSYHRNHHHLSALTPPFIPAITNNDDGHDDDDDLKSQLQIVPFPYFMMLPQFSMPLSLFPNHFMLPPPPPPHHPHHHPPPFLPPIYFNNDNANYETIKPCTFPYFVKSTFCWVKDLPPHTIDEPMKPFTVINVHAPIHQGMREKYWKEISYHLNKFPKSIAIGDFNKFDDHRPVYDRILHTKFKTDLIPKEQITFVSWDEDRNPQNGELWRSSLDGCVINNKIFKGYVDVLDSVQPPRLSDHFLFVASLFWAN